MAVSTADIADVWRSIRVDVKGVSCHGSAPERGSNAIYKMADIIADVRSLNNNGCDEDTDIKGLVKMLSPKYNPEHYEDAQFLGRGTCTVSQIFYTSPSRCAVADSCAIDPETFLQIAVAAKDQDGVSCAKTGLRRNRILNFAIMAHSDDVDAILLPDVDLRDTHANPLVRQIDFEQIMISVEINKIPDVVRATANGGPLGQLFFRVDDFIRTVAQQKLGLYIPLCTRDHKLCAQLLEQ